MPFLNMHKLIFWLYPHLIKWAFSNLNPRGNHLLLQSDSSNVGLHLLQNLSYSMLFQVLYVICKCSFSLFVTINIPVHLKIILKNCLWIFNCVSFSLGLMIHISACHSCSGVLWYLKCGMQWKQINGLLIYVKLLHLHCSLYYILKRYMW